MPHSAQASSRHGSQRRCFLGGQNMRLVLRSVSLVVSAALAGTVAVGDARAAGADRAKLVGVWRLTAVTAKAGETVTHPLGDHPSGLVIFAENGAWSAQLMAERHAEVPASTDPRTTYRAHFGTFTVDEAARKIVLHRQGDLDAAGVGQDTIRYYQFVGDTIVLTLPTDHRQGVDVVTTVVWQRESHAGTGRRF